MPARFSQTKGQPTFVYFFSFPAFYQPIFSTRDSPRSLTMHCLNRQPCMVQTSMDNHRSIPQDYARYNRPWRDRRVTNDKIAKWLSSSSYILFYAPWSSWPRIQRMAICNGSTALSTVSSWWWLAERGISIAWSMGETFPVENTLIIITPKEIFSLLKLSFDRFWRMIFAMLLHAF